jgi:hypothetical protein
LLRAFAAGMAAAALLLVAAPGTAQQPPATARAMSAYELYLLYRDTTWPWESGAAHFFDEGRRFIAWATDERGLSRAEGRFELTDTGSMCLVGRWTGLYYPTGLRYARPVRSCFRHVTDGETVWQRAAIGGTWAPFAGPEVNPAPLQPSDGRAVAEGIAEVTATLETLGRARPPRAPELLALYGDRSWDWGDGGVHFFAGDRRFVAYVENADTLTVGEGRFTLTDRGLLCLVGEWSGVDLGSGSTYADVPSRRCFLHLQNAERVFRAEAGSADWQALQDRASGRAIDLVEADIISAPAERLRARLAAW